MRELKFRAWVDNKSMDYEPYIGAIVGIFYEDIRVSDLNFSLKSTPAVFMQYTGLHDKKGTEIWEGDIVKHGFHYYVVEFLEGCFIIKCSSEPWLCLLGRLDEIVEVIGNIYENPELLDRYLP